jgi:hypothetical protein
MTTFRKERGKDFKILNLTDTQLSNEEWAEGHHHRAILEYTVSELVERVRPDLITVSGDLAWAGHDHAYLMLAELLDGFGIPWAPVWGNHDNQNGAEYVDAIATKYMGYKGCIYEKGDPALGNGNYVICIEENGAPVEAVVMLDTHDRSPYTDENGVTRLEWARLLPEQAEWLKKELGALKARGCRDATLVMHIPIYAYRLASAAAYKEGIDLKSITPEMADGEECWNDGYTDSIGVQYEGIGSYPEDDGMLEVFKEIGIIKHLVAGHDHVNNFMITYGGIKMIYALKAGAGCYWDPALNGGTVISINESGVHDVRHEYVNVEHLLS